MARPLAPVSSPDWYAGVPHSTRGHTAFGFAFLIVLVLGFGVWAEVAPLAGAVVTNGAFVASGQNKTIQHLEGGLIKEIRIKEGDLVVPDQVLIRLDDTAARAELRRLAMRRDRLAAIEFRLLAEMREDRELVFPTELAAHTGDEDYRQMIANQALTFAARRKTLDSDLAVLRDGIDGLEQKISGSMRQRAATARQIDLLQQELDAKSFLLKGGEIRKSDVLALQRAIASAEGEIGRLDGDIGDAKERIARTKEQMIGARNTAIKAAAEQLNDMHAEQNDIRERMHAASAVLERIDIVAPARGVVVKLRYHTPGGVIEPGKSILEIVPLDEELLIEARVRPQDISNLHRGQPAGIRLTALSQRVTPIVNGTVVYVSADTVPDEKRAQALVSDQYLARIRLDPGEAEKVRAFAPLPGMPAEVYIKTSERTFLDYLMRPLRDSMQRAFRES